MLNKLLIVTAMALSGATSTPHILKANNDTNIVVTSQLWLLDIYSATINGVSGNVYQSLSIVPAYKGTYDLTHIVTANSLNVSFYVRFYTIDKDFSYTFTGNLPTDTFNLYSVEQDKTTNIYLQTVNDNTSNNSINLTYIDNQAVFNFKTTNFILNYLNVQKNSDGAITVLGIDNTVINGATYSASVSSSEHVNSFDTDFTNDFFNKINTHTFNLATSKNFNFSSTQYGTGYDAGYATGYSAGQLNPTTLSWLKGTVSLVYQLFDFPLMGSITLGGVIGASFLILIFSWIIRWFR